MSWDDDEFDMDTIPQVYSGGANGAPLSSWEDMEEGIDNLGIGGAAGATGSKPPSEGKKQPQSMKPKHVAKAKREELQKKEKGGKLDMNTPLDDPVEEKKRQEYLQRQSELELAEDTFGANDNSVEVPEDEMTEAIRNLPLKNASAYESAAKKLTERLFDTEADDTPAARRQAARSKLNGKRFIEQLLRDSVDHLSLDDLNDISTVIKTAQNAKIKAENDKKKKGKNKGKKNPKVQNEREVIQNQGDDELGGEYDDFMM